MSSPTTKDYLKWCETLKIELKEKSKINVEARMDKIEKIVNDIITRSDITDVNIFSIKREDKTAIIGKIENKIDSWRGVEIEVCKNKQKKNFSSYQSTARNWFNRNKAKIYGNYLFYEIIFITILEYCSFIGGIQNQLLLFIDIFECILSEPMQFPRTKLQPLIPHQSLMQPNQFKKACQKFTNFYDVIFDTKDNNNKDRDRAKKIHNSFMNCLVIIKNKKNITRIPYPFCHIMNEKQTFDTIIQTTNVIEYDRITNETYTESNTESIIVNIPSITNIENIENFENFENINIDEYTPYYPPPYNNTSTQYNTNPIIPIPEYAQYDCSNNPQNISDYYNPNICGYTDQSSFETQSFINETNCEDVPPVMINQQQNYTNNYQNLPNYQIYPVSYAPIHGTSFTCNNDNNNVNNNNNNCSQIRYSPYNYHTNFDNYENPQLPGLMMGGFL